MPKAKKRKFRGTTPARETPRGRIAKVTRHRGTWNQLVEEADLPDNLAPEPEFYEEYEKSRSRLAEKYGKHTRGKMYIKKAGQDLAAQISSGKITSKEASTIIEGLKKVKKKTANKKLKGNDAGVDPTRNVRPLHGYLGGDKEAYKYLKAGPAKSVEWLNAVLGSKTKKVYMKKMISGPVGYLPVLTALMNEISMSKEKKQKKRNG